MDWRPAIGFILALATAIVGAPLLWSTPAWPQQVQCLPVAVAERALMTEFGERQIAVGHSKGNSVRWYANADTRTWTVLVVNGRGAACPIASGTDLDFAKPPVPGRAS